MDTLGILSSSIQSGREDPWTAFADSGMIQNEPHLKGARSSPYGIIRAFWANPQEISPEIELQMRLGKAHLPSQAITYLLQKAKTPFAPSFEEALSQQLNLIELCQLALLWGVAGEMGPARELANWLLKFAGDRPLFSFWCKESEFDETEGWVSFALLLRSFGKFKEAEEYLKKIKSPVDPFFHALAIKAPPFSIGEQSLEDPKRGVSVYAAEKMRMAIALSGKGTPLGVLSASGVEIRAMGPQALPIGSKGKFGIQRAVDGNPMNGWTRCKGILECWMEVKADIKNLSLNFVGVGKEALLGFVFYIKADECKVGSEIFKPKSLKS